MHLIRMRLGGIPPFTEPVEFEFDERVNVFVGPNASGKSTVQQMLAQCLMGQEETSKRRILRGLKIVSDNEFGEAIENFHDSGAGGILSSSEDWLDAEYKPVVINIGSIRSGLPDVRRMEYLDSYDENTVDIMNESFSGERTMRALDFFDAIFQVQSEPDQGDESYTSTLADLGLTPEEINDNIRAGRIILDNMVEIAGACCEYICGEVIKDAKPHNYRSHADMFALMNVENPTMDDFPTRPYMGIITNDHTSGSRNVPSEAVAWSDSYYDDVAALIKSPVYLGHLSSGTEGTLLWVRWLALKMVFNYGFHDGWEKQPAILLIDEIENHLHPTWQRRVIPALLEHFPGLQIFATTHSPFVVAGLKKGQVHMLKRDADGVVTASTNDHDIIGWTTDEILRTFMGVDEPTDQLTVERANRLRELRGKDELSPEEAEELERLRRQVNEDFMSSSAPLEAQRERYGDMMLEFLRSRQSDLSQDGS